VASTYLDLRAITSLSGRKFWAMTDESVIAYSSVWPFSETRHFSRDTFPPIPWPMPEGGGAFKSLKKKALTPEFTLQIFALSRDQSHRHEQAGLTLLHYTTRHIIISHHVIQICNSCDECDNEPTTKTTIPGWWDGAHHCLCHSNLELQREGAIWPWSIVT
jgi:hypothetical protein